MPDVQSLIQHLREDPTARERPADELARQFGVETEFVRMAVASMPKSAPRRETGAEGRDDVTPWLERMRAAWRRATDRPIAFVAVTMLLLCGASVAHRLLVQIFGQPLVGIGLLFPVFVAMTLAHFAVYFQEGKARVALMGTATFAGGLALFSVTRMTEPVGAQFAAGIVSTLVVTFLYALFAVPVTLLGGYVAVHRETSQERRMSRQELLERLFEVRERLNTYPRPARRAWREHPALVWLRKHLTSVAVVSGFFVGAVSFLLMALTDPTGEIRTGPPEQVEMSAIAPFLIVSLMTSALSLLLSFGVGFLAGRPLRAVGYGSLYFLASSAPLLVPMLGQGWSAVTAALLGAHLVTVAFALVIPMAGGVTAAIEDHAARKRALDENDPDALMAEMLELEWKLRPSSSRVCVMVVDVAGSTALKEGADPFDAEWSFREYQSIVERESSAKLGNVHSTAGDGAVVGFPDAQRALAAARAVHAEVERFNASRNRLGGPFRLRIGLHTGDVGGDLDEVQFSAVIDVAAHAEAACPVGGTAATAPTVEELGLELHPLDRKLPDGSEVYVLDAPAETTPSEPSTVT